MLYTYQDFVTDKEKSGVICAVQNAINNHMHSDAFKIAKSADAYDHQQNETIYNYVRMIFTMTGTPVEDFTASNNKIASNFFHRLNTQRNTYLLGNGVSFSDHVEDEEEINIETGEVETVTVDTTKEALGKKFDTDLQKAGYNSLIHGVTFGFWNLDRLHVFPITEFAPLWDEEDGSLRAGVRFWQIDKNKPLIAVLYEEDGYTKFKSKEKTGTDLEETKAKRAYKLRVKTSEEDGEEVIGEENYGSLPIVPLWGSKLHQSTLVGMQHSIDSFDLIRSGFANDLTDCAQIYWILENCSGMDDTELAKFRDRLKIQHIATADTENSKVTPYTQDIPYAARKEYLDEIRAGIYEDFGGLDVHTIAAGATNDHIDAAYQPMDEEADDFEFQIIEFIQQILALMGIEDTPIFKRNRISNQKEQTDMILSASEYLDEETILSKLPFISVDEVADILLKKRQESEDRFDEDEGFIEDESLLEEEDEDLLEEDEEVEEEDTSQIDSMIARLQEILGGI